MFLITAVVGASLSAFGMGGQRPTPPPGTIAADRRMLSFADGEACAVAQVVRPPSALIQPEQEGRLIEPLRSIARLGEPMAALTASAASHLGGDTIRGNAYADLAVTGARAYAKFKALHRQGLLNEAVLSNRLRQDPRFQTTPVVELGRASRLAIERAYTVLHALAGGGGSTARAQLGWIAVSGEDDRPHLPVNAPATAEEQRELVVPVGSHSVRTRYVIAEALRAPRPVTPPPSFLLRTLPSNTRPELSTDARVLLFIPGMDSRLEEASDLVAAMRNIARETGENWTIISLDLPNNGYADAFDHRKVSPMEAIGTPRHIGFNARGRQEAPGLDFIEEFITSFVDTLDHEVPVKARLEAVIGGSLGGNMTFRLGRRTDLPWLKRVVSWSPASIWGGLADGADLFKQIAVATAWKRAGGNAEELVETPEQRAKFFEMAFGGAIAIGPIVIVPAQPDHWWSKDWPCFATARQAAQEERREIYGREFRLWHWRIATEQIVYSHQRPPNLSEPRYLSNRVPMLLAAGENDDFNFTNLFTATRNTAREMVRTPGRALFFRATGHSIHAERPLALARLIRTFVQEVPPAP